MLSMVSHHSANALILNDYYCTSQSNCGEPPATGNINYTFRGHYMCSYFTPVYDYDYDYEIVLFRHKQNKKETSNFFPEIII